MVEPPFFSYCTWTVLTRGSLHWPLGGPAPCYGKHWCTPLDPGSSPVWWVWWPSWNAVLFWSYHFYVILMTCMETTVHTVGMSHSQTCHWHLSRYWHEHRLLTYWQKQAEEQRQEDKDWGAVWMLMRIQSSAVSRAEKHRRVIYEAAPVWELSQMQ